MHGFTQPRRRWHQCDGDCHHYRPLGACAAHVSSLTPTGAPTPALARGPLGGDHLDSCCQETRRRKSEAGRPLAGRGGIVVGHGAGRMWRWRGRRWRQHNAVESRDTGRHLHADGDGHGRFRLLRCEPQHEPHAECLLGRGRGRNLIPACEGVVFIHRIRKRLPAGSPLITTDCWKPQARGQANRSSLVAYCLPIPSGSLGTRKLDTVGKLTPLPLSWPENVETPAPRYTLPGRWMTESR